MKGYGEGGPSILTSFHTHDPRQEDQHLRLIRADQKAGNFGLLASPLVIFDQVVWQRCAVSDGVVHHFGGCLRIGIELGHIFLHLGGGRRGETALLRLQTSTLLI